MGVLAGISVETKLVAATVLLAYVVARRWLSNLGTDVSNVRKPSRGHWLWGHEKAAWMTPDGNFYLRNINEMGQVFRMKGGLFHPDILAVSDPGALNHIFTKNSYTYLKSQVIRPLIDRILGKSLPWAEGDQHKRQRATLAPVFTAENVKRMDEEIRSSADKLVEVLRDHLGEKEKEAKDWDVEKKKGKALGVEGGVLVNVLDWSCRATLDIIGKVGFGHDFQCGLSPESILIQNSWRQLTLSGLDFPGFLAPLVIRAFPFIADLPVKAIQQQGEIKTIVKRLAREMIEDRVRSGESNTKGKDLMSTLMRMTEAGGADLDQLLDHICTFVMVGHETTSATINFTLLELARNPSVQDTLRKEILDFKGSGPGGEPTYEEFQVKLPFLDAVTKESMRMYPSASHTERIVQRDDVLPLRFPVTGKDGREMTSIKIKKGQIISVPTIAINRNSHTWGLDANQFKPERWLSQETMPPPTSMTQGWNGIFSFLEGPRLCIGYRLALFEYKVIMCALIKNFEFHDTGAKIVTRFSSTLQPYIDGRLEEGIQIPLVVKDIHV